jgi:FkbM family methyltransferase
MPHIINCSLVPGDIYFDVGANVGQKADYLIKKGLKVILIEPQPEIFEILTTRYKNNSNVIFLPFALGRKAGMASMSISSNAQVLSTFADHWKEGRFANIVWDRNLDVKMITLDEIIRDFGVPRYCKIDVEGYELDVILGLSERIGIISYEFTHEFMPIAFDVLQHLIKLGYTRFNFSIGESEEFQCRDWVSYSELIKFLGNNNDPGLWGDIYAN